MLSFANNIVIYLENHKNLLIISKISKKSLNGQT